MKKYDDSEIAKIHEPAGTVKVNGADVQLKESPGRKGKGYMDPYELAIIQDNWAASDGEEGENPFEADLPMDEMIPFLRDIMGFANLNLNTKELITKYETVEAAGNQIGLWRYYLRRGTTDPKPCLIFIHGGGWIGGTVYCVENSCKLICELADAVVFNVDYDLSPEVKFPVAANECYDVVKHVYEHADEYGIDKNRITVAGDSAGGNLSAVISLKDRDEGTHYIHQEILLYPAVTFGRYAADGYAWDIKEYEISKKDEKAIKGSLMLGRPTDLEGNMEADAYLGDIANAASPYASPMMAKDFTGLPKTIVITAEYDGLRLQGEFYGSQLANAGVDTTIYRYCGCTHAIIDRLGFQPQTEEICLTIAEAL